MLGANEGVAVPKQRGKLRDVVLFASSPSDVHRERSILLDEVRRLNGRLTSRHSPRIATIGWPDGIAAGSAGYAQSVINKQFEACEILVATIGTRLGSPTPRANSGTEEEFDRAIDASFRGRSITVLAFFSNLPTPLLEIDPHQLLLVHYFRAKAARLGVLYHSYTTLTEYRLRLRRSLSAAYANAIRARLNAVVEPARARPEEVSVERKLLGATTFRRTPAPQWAGEPFIVPLAEFRNSVIEINGKFRSESPYFRFGFKYHDSREQIFSPGSVQTFGQNMLVHIGRNSLKGRCFVTAYRSGIRLGPDTGLSRVNPGRPCVFSVAIRLNGLVAVTINGVSVFQAFFLVDGIPSLAFLAWGDEHKFECDFTEIELIARRSAPSR